MPTGPNSDSPKPPPQPLYSGGPSPSPSGAGGKGVLLAVVMGVALLAALGGGLVWWFVRADAPTAAREAEAEACRAATLTFAQRAQHPVAVKLIATASGIPKVDAAVSRAEALLQGYAARSNGQLTFRKEALDPADAAELKLQPVKIKLNGKEASLMLGLVVEYGEARTAFQAVEPDEFVKALPSVLAARIREVMSKAGEFTLPIGLVTGVEELRLDEAHLVPLSGGQGPSLKGILGQNFPYYALNEVELKSGASLAEQRALLLTQPGRKLAEAELRALDEFLMLGERTLVVIAGAANIAAKDPQLQARLDWHGLDGWLGKYGIEPQPDVILDFGSALQLRSAEGGVRVASVLVARDSSQPSSTAQFEHGFVPFSRLNELAFPFASSLVLHPERQPKAQLESVVRSSNSTVAQTQAGSLHPSVALVPPDGPSEPRTLAAVLDGTIHSAFTDKEAKGRILLVAASQFGTNPFARASNEPNADLAALVNPNRDRALPELAGQFARAQLTSTILVFKEILDWAVMNEELAPCFAFSPEPRR